jgi:cytochrome P450
MKQWFSAVRHPGRTQHPAVRLCHAADIQRYSRFTNPEAARAQERFIEVLRSARAYAGLRENKVDTEGAGDGQFAVLPPGVDESVVIPDLVAGVSLALQDVNADLDAHARLRLRIALHRGLLKPHINGWVGTSAIAVHRLLDSVALRSALDREPAADFALIVSDALYGDVIAHGYGSLLPDQFDQVAVDVPATHFAERAWLYLGGRQVRAE